MAKIVRYATFIVIQHFVILCLHAFAHVKLEVWASLLGNVFIVVIIWIAPIVAMILLRQQRYPAGVILFLSSMVGSLLFGVYNHFIAISPDHVYHIPAGEERELFQITAALLALVELVGSIVGIWAWRVMKSVSH